MILTTFTNYLLNQRNIILKCIQQEEIVKKMFFVILIAWQQICFDENKRKFFLKFTGLMI